MTGCNLRIIPQRNRRPSLRHGLSDRIPNPVSRACDGYDLAGHLELVEDIGGRVGERAREAVADDGAVLLCHGHGGGVCGVCAEVLGEMFVEFLGVRGI